MRSKGGTRARWPSVIVAGVIAVSAGLWRPSAQALPAGGARDAVGPFPSWTNAKSAYRAIGDGVADDTASLQRALNDLAAGKGSPVLYLPPGNYRITRTLSLASVMSVAIEGDDPATTTIAWDGEAGGAMLTFNGVAHSRVSRLTFDGRHKAGAAVEQSWDGKQQFFDTGNEYADLVFTDSDYGIRGGFAGYGFAETSIMRSRFLRNTKAGISLGNFNALDVWIWDSLFEDCLVGVTNDPGAGNFRVYDSVFRRSQQADLAMQNTGLFSARGNYSIDSKSFFVSGPAINHPATIDLQANTIVDPTDTAAVRLGSQGPGTFIDNEIRSLPAARSPVVSWRSFIDADLASIGNTFTVPTPTFNNGRLVSFNDRVVARDTLSPAEPVLPATPRRIARPVIEVTAGAGAVEIQQAIDRAAILNAPSSIVHLPYGRYEIDKTLIVPPGDVQIVGDGYRTLLDWVGGGQGTVVSVRGPSHAVFRDLMIGGGHRADVVKIATAGSRTARVYLEGSQLRDGRESNLTVDRAADTVVDLVNSDHSDSAGASFQLASGITTIFSGSSSNNTLSYDVSGRASLVARDIWYEGRAPNGFVRASGAAAVTVYGARVATPAQMTTPAFVAADLSGTLTLLTTHIDDQIATVGRGGSASILGLSLMREFRESPIFENRAVPPARALFLNVRQRARNQGRFSPGSAQVRDSGVPDAAFIARMLSDARARLRPSPLARSAADATDIRLFRVWLNAGRNNLVVAR